VESNPGPATSSTPDSVLVFHIWASKYGPTFVQAVERLELARGSIIFSQKLEVVGLSLETFQLKWSLTDLDIHALPDLVVGYEVFAGVSLDLSNSDFQWLPSKAALDLTSLQEEIKLLKVQLVTRSHTPPAPPPLTPLSSSTLSYFQTLPNKAQWMTKMSGVFSNFLLSHPADHPVPPPILELWEIMTDAHQDNQRRFRPSPQPSRSNAGMATFSLDQALQNGGRLAYEKYPKGSVQFLHYQDKTWYISQKSRQAWDTSIAPPSACYGCGEHHWFWQCATP
jgi:hypothetical protein